MVLKDIKFENLETKKVKCMQFSCDGQRAVIHWLDLYPVEIFTGNEADQGFYLQVRKQEYYTEYIVWNDCEKRIAVKFGNIDEECEISVLSELLIHNGMYKGSDGYKRLLRQKEEKKKYINLVDIAALTAMGENVLAEHYQQYREEYLQQKEREELEKRQRMEEENKRRQDEQKKVIEQKLAEAEMQIKNNKMVQNEQLDDGKYVILCLMKKYGIKVPLKTQGWINSKLANVTFGEKGEISLQFYRYKGCKCSESVYRYLALLWKAVVEVV